jgi:molecular chaperone HscB
MLDFSKSYFELFGIAPGFEIDADALAERYRELQRVVHPDRFANASDQERRLAVQGSSHINEAFRTLRDPLSRAGYLLALHGGAEAGAADATTTDPAFLMEQMELRETLAEAREADDPHRVVASVVRRLDAQREALLARLAGQLSDPGPEDLAAARDAVARLRFVEKLRTEAEDLEAELDEGGAG